MPYGEGKKRIIISIIIWATKKPTIYLSLTERVLHKQSLNGKITSKIRGSYQECQDERQTKRLGGKGMLRSQEQADQTELGSRILAEWTCAQQRLHSQFCRGRGMSQQLLPEELLSALSRARWTTDNQQQQWRTGRATTAHTHTHTLYTTATWLSCHCMIKPPDAWSYFNM